MSTKKKMAILVAGGPAPGINSVIGSVTIRAALEGVEVIGLRDGFKWIMQGDITHIKELNIDNVSRIHFRGGSFLGIARDNPTKNKDHLQNVIDSLMRLNVDKLITIGGDDTAFSAMTLEKMAEGRISVVHVPKTIDNDLDLPHGIPTFGYQTARHIGVEIVKNLMVDANTTSRWYFVVAMGRKAGHLALGIGKAAGATLTLISEEFKGEYISMRSMVDVLVGAIIKRHSSGREDGIAILAEGLVERLDPKELAKIAHVELDDHDNLRIAEVDFGQIIKQEVQKRLVELDIKTTIIAKDIGYEVRCADPIPFDMEYTRDLGHSAAQFILQGGNAAMVSIQEGNFVPMYFKDIVDKKTNKTKVRMVDVESEYFKIARRYMLRLKKSDFDDTLQMAKYAETSNLTIDEFREQFYPVIENDLYYNGKKPEKNGMGVPQADGIE
ncbi:MAG: diphosphate--fructose-6-phosphate 1-phosphotransferase [Balneolales bacterium]